MMSVLGPSVVNQQLQYLSDDDEDAAGLAPEPIKVRLFSFFYIALSFVSNIAYDICHDEEICNKLVTYSCWILAIVRKKSAPI